jgi:hypothetical protein
LLIALLLLTGCPVPNGGGGDTDETDGNVGVDAADYPNKRVAGEPNDLFSIPIDVIFDSASEAQLYGDITTTSDVDVYSLGPLSEGDRIVVDVSVPGTVLDAAMAIFDSSERLVIENDDRNLSLFQFDPYVDHIMRYSDDEFFLAITSAPAAPSTGEYEVDIRLSTAAVPEPWPQVVLLEFDGGSVTIPFDATYDVGPFDAADVSPSYAGQTEALIDQIVAVVRDRFDGLGLDIRVSPGDPEPAEEYSLVLFGERNPAAFGVSEGVDTYNTDYCDDSIIFTGSFSPTRFGRVLDLDELGTAIGNVAAHEIGHLLGLNHVTDIEDLMDTTGGATTLLADQRFMTSPLHHSIFPLGLQDGMMLLLDTIGPAQ